MEDFVFFPVKPVKVSVPSAQRGEPIPVLLPVFIFLMMVFLRAWRRRRAGQGNGRARGTLLTLLRVKREAKDGKKVAKAEPIPVLLPVFIFLMMVFLRAWRRRRAGQGNGRARGTLLTSLRVKREAKDGKKVAKAVLKPIEQAMQPWIGGPRSREFDYNIFTVGGRITDVCGTKATIVGVDEDGDLPVFTDDGKMMIFYAKNCRKALSVGDRVFNTQRQEVAEVIRFDHMDDPVVVKPNQLRSVWPRCVTERLPSIGDRVHHACETIGTVEGFDEDGDFQVKMSNGTPAVWYAHKCKQGIGCLPKKSSAEELLEELP